MTKYYEIFELNKTKDGNGTIIKQYISAGLVRGNLTDKRTIYADEALGLVELYSKQFITNKIYKSKLSIGSKIGDYTIKNIIEYSNIIVCIMNN